MQYNDEKSLQFNKTLGEVLAKIRETKGITSNRFAEEYELDSSNLWRIENGVVNCKFITIWKIVEALGLKFTDFAQIMENSLGPDFKFMDE